MISTTSVAPQVLEVIPDQVQQLRAVNVEYDNLGLNDMDTDLGLDNEIRTVIIPEETHLLVQSAHPSVERTRDVKMIQDIKANLDLPDSPKHEGHPRVQHKYHAPNDEDLITEITESTTPEFVLNLEDELKGVIDGNPTLKPLDNIEQDIEHNFDKVLEDIYPEGRAELRNAKWYTYIYYFRWFANFVFVGCPYMFWSSMMVIVNIILNILLNKWWAGGNWLLIFNTGYLMFQTVMSWPLIFEIPFYLRNLRYFRIFSSGAAFLYTAVYFFIVFDWIYQLDWEPETVYEDYEFLDIIVNMYLGYNVLFNIHLMPVNFAIIFKEIFLEIFPPMLNQNRGARIDGKDFEDVVSPQTYGDLIKYGKLPDTQDHQENYDQKFVTRMEQKKREQAQKKLDDRLKQQKKH